MQAIVGGKIITMAGKTITKGTVLLEHGKIIAVGEQLTIPAGADCYDATGMVVLPGFIDAHTHLGIAEEVYRIEGDDVNENTDPVTPQLMAIDAINPQDIGFQDALAAGVTTVVTGPGSANVIGGEMVCIKTMGQVVDEMVVQHPIGLKAALGENPKRTYGPQKTPATRMAMAALLRDTLLQGSVYVEKAHRAQKKGKAMPRDLKMEAVARVIRREIPLRVHAHRADDIMTAVRIANEFGIRLIIEHCTDGNLVARQLARAGVPAVIGPLITSRAKVEMQRLSLETAAVLAGQGVEVAIMTDHPVIPIQYLTVSAGLAARGGLGEEQALAAITIAPARILGLEDRIGSITPGKDGDLVILDGHPFDLRTRVKRVYVNGEVFQQ